MNDRWAAIFKASPLTLLVLDREGTILEINRVTPPFRREEVVGRSSFDFLPPSEVAAARERHARVLATGVAEKVELHLADGRYFSVQRVPVLRDGEITEVLLLSEDRTESKRLQDELERRERVFRALVEKSSDGFLLLDEDARVLYASPSTVRLLGRDLANSTPFVTVHPDDLPRARAFFERAKCATTTEPLREHFRVPLGGEMRIFEVVLVNMLDDDDVRGIVANYHDVTELERARQERDRFFDLSPDLLVVAGPDGYFKRLNPAWECALGWTREEMMARPYVDFVHPDDRVMTKHTHDRAVSGPVASFENRYRCRDGSYRWIQWKSSVDTTSGVIYAIARDVTDKKRVDQQLLHAQKMEAVARLAGGVAHDINNMLAVIYASTEFLLGSMSKADPNRADIVDIQQVSERSAGLVRQLLAFGRKGPRSVRDVEIDEAVESVAKMITRVVGENVEVVTRAGARSAVHLDPTELESVLMNLALNARDAMPSGGTIEITTALRQIGGAYASHLGVSPGLYVALSVRDTGCGIPIELRHKIFEPFFTTKEIGKGTGLGLATVFGIVQESSGAVEMDTTEGAGSTFTVLFPCARRPGVRAVSPQTGPSVPSAPSASPS